MKIAELDGIRLHYREDGDPDGPPVVFGNSLGTDLRLWDQLLPLLPQGYRYIRYDKRGHGLSDCPSGPYPMGTLVRDAEQLIEHLKADNAIFVGLSIGGLIAQGLAAKRPDLLRGIVLSNTGAKIGTREMWDDRMAGVRKGGIEALADPTMERWFSAAFRTTAPFHAWRHMLVRQPQEGYLGCCAAIAGTDFYSTTAAITLPALGIAGSEDGSTPPDLVRETVELIQGSEFRLIRGAGHLPCVEAPETYARHLTDFLTRVAG
ncbi:3-oxoadipate enol-lactonase [Roseivivax sp. GX 12232]|uniref:3-oxoadipate enol-lactonase n=1 Tax=Roseivivax sp. GX 12232 TaxID=2900547 RepID=UPI001E4E694A|nr:3-oxoadipate enol-lactonase [Roseivivax sp. GX 12232]MCE0506890.1 3-oxoadipate enol-lactonase [Roseivivax sp. GX 12232]